MRKHEAPVVYETQISTLKQREQVSPLRRSGLKMPGIVTVCRVCKTQDSGRPAERAADNLYAVPSSHVKLLPWKGPFKTVSGFIRLCCCNTTLPALR